MSDYLDTTTNILKNKESNDIFLSAQYKFDLIGEGINHEELTKGKKSCKNYTHRE